MVRKPVFTSDEAAPSAPDDGGRTRILGDGAEADAPPTRPLADVPGAADAASAPAAASTDAHGHARPKTRLHGYEPADSTPETGPIAEVTGWLVVVEGPGRGANVPLTVGMNAVGRGDDVNARVDFGDEAISRDAHAFITYDHEQRKFLLSHAGKANVVRLNDDAVVTAMEMADRDKIRIGDTTLQFVSYCGPDFDWSTN